ncbi:unnamed protein product [Linum tenue]|uniref:Uncharacterized protein n=1 Tax=Linum tenue TaxID=586396 RepID=A0AAV0PSG0_9ROSI|nr:unnamed protein product [Linum tenue]
MVSVVKIRTRQFINHEPSHPTSSLQVKGGKVKMFFFFFFLFHLMKQEELKAVDVLQPASKCCREVHEYVDGRQDPFISKKEESHLLHKPCLSWKQLW